MVKGKSNHKGKSSIYSYKMRKRTHKAKKGVLRKTKNISSKRKKRKVSKKKKMKGKIMKGGTVGDVYFKTSNISFLVEVIKEESESVTIKRLPTFATKDNPQPDRIISKVNRDDSEYFKKFKLISDITEDEVISVISHFTKDKQVKNIEDEDEDDEDDDEYYITDDTKYKNKGYITLKDREGKKFYEHYTRIELCKSLSEKNIGDLYYKVDNSNLVIELLEETCHNVNVLILEKYYYIRNEPKEIKKGLFKRTFRLVQEIGDISLTFEYIKDKIVKIKIKEKEDFLPIEFYIITDLKHKNKGYIKIKNIRGEEYYENYTRLELAKDGEADKFKEELHKNKIENYRDSFYLKHDGNYILSIESFKKDISAGRLGFMDDLITGSHHSPGIEKRNEIPLPWIPFIGWSFPSKVALEGITNYLETNFSEPTTFLSIGSAPGLWEAAIQQKANEKQLTNIKVIATDNFTTTHFSLENVKPEIIKEVRDPFNFMNIELLDGTEAVKMYKPDILFMCWPPQDSHISTMDIDALTAFNGNVFIYIGEGSEGCTGTKAFHKEIENNWVKVSTFKVVNPSKNDFCFIYERKEGGGGAGGDAGDGGGSDTTATATAGGGGAGGDAGDGGGSDTTATATAGGGGAGGSE
jgi:hypothetical protein